MLETLLSLVLIYTYPLIFIVGFLASFGIPLPATALFIASWAFVGAGYMEWYILFLIGWSACVLWDITGYSLMKRYGKWVWKTLWLDRFVAIETIEKKYGGHMETRGFLLIFTSRFLFTAIGSSVNILAGFMKTGWRTFLIADITWEFLYALITIGLGYSFASQWEMIVSLFSSASLFLSSAFILIGLALIIYKHRFRFAR